MYRYFTFISVIFLISSLTAHGQSPHPDSSSTIEVIEIYPPIASKFKCSEHPLGQEGHPGDALAKDCNVIRYNAGPKGLFPNFYAGDGIKNKDWYSWKEPLLAPFDAKIVLIHINPITNQPGTKGQGPSSFIVFQKMGSDESMPIQVGYVHVRDVQVQEGDAVQAGQMIARIGNNGIAWYPHVHIGALRGDITKMMSGELSPEHIEPLQIRFDLAALGHLRGYINQ